MSKSMATESPKPLFDEADLMEFAEGRVSNVLGALFAPVDLYRRRVRLPSPPFMALSRVVEISGVPGTMKDATIRTEYDIPGHAWNALDGQASQLTLDPQGALVLAAWLGIDFESKGARAYRWVDADLTYCDRLPRVGERIDYEIHFGQSVVIGESRIVRGRCRAYVEGRITVDAPRMTIGFFTDEALEFPVNWVPRRTLRAQSLQNDRPRMWPARGSLERVDLLALSHGHLAEVFSRAVPADARNPSLRLPSAILQFVDRVAAMSTSGGVCGLGSIEAEWVVNPDHWAVRSHFKDDPIVAGPCMVEGAVQALHIYALAVGLHRGVSAGRFEPVVNSRVSIRFGAQVRARGQVLRYCVDIVDVQLRPDPSLVADVEIVDEGAVVGRIEGLGVRIVAETTNRTSGARNE
ncbi:hypothetical protein K2Z84_00910 [Candidatus Binatia bacterium]|nr:hypothetical protein [Candidatus Binatia bacterium]